MPAAARFLFVFEPTPVTGDTKLDCVQQILVAERLGEEFNRSAFHRLDSHRNVAMTRDKNDRQTDVGTGEVALEIKSAAPGEAYIEYEAGGVVRAADYPAGRVVD